METQRVTIRLPQHDIHSIDLFVRAGEFATRSEVIRHAVNDFIKNYANNIIEKAEKIKKGSRIGTCCRIHRTLHEKIMV